MISPFDCNEWPAVFDVMAFENDDQGDLIIGRHAYFADVARHYAYHETLFLLLFGRLPNDAEARLFDICLKANIGFSFRKAAWLAGLTSLTINRDPVISTCVASLASSEEVLDLEAAIVELFALLDEAELKEVPGVFKANGCEEGRLAISQILSALKDDGWAYPQAISDFNVNGCLLVVLHLLGCRSVHSAKFFLLFTSLPLVFREMAKNDKLDFRRYAANTPAYDYVFPEGSNP